MAGQGIKVGPLFMGGTAIMLLWSAVTGKKWSAVLKDLIAGKNPSQIAATNTITGTDFAASLGYGAGLPGGTPGSAKISQISGTGVSAWATALLHSIGAPVTAANLTSIEGWVAHEGGGGANNPLNTTLRTSGSTGSFNSVGVQNYVSEAAGLTATVETILGGGYSDILMALRSGGGLCGRSWAGLSRWSGGGYSSVC